jgi:ribosome-associated translation inhibitor RaiA
MDIRITGNNVSISAALRGYTERRFRTAVGDAGPNEIEVRLSDVNGPRGGLDKECAVRAVLRRAGVVFVRARGEDAYSTVDKAAGRLKSAVGRRVGRYRSTRRRSAGDSREVHIGHT